MELLDKTFSDRLSEIDAYLDLLATLEEEVRSGPPKVGSTVITTVQQRMLYSSVYLQLYNLIEATITKCVEALCKAISKDDRWTPADLSPDLRREWVRYLARTHADLNYDNRLSHTLSLCEHLIQAKPVSQIQIEKGGGGNWHDEEIYRFAERLGCALALSAKANEAAKRPFRNDYGALALIVKFRNDLAHGMVSFVECGDGVTVGELRELKIRTATYMTEVVAAFKSFIETHAFLKESSRPREEPA